VIEKIISGGQTGADRAALDFALARGIAHGGWCPRGRLTEDGRLDARFQLAETPSSDPLQRTEWNVRDSDATVIFSIRETLASGSEKTVGFAQAYKKPFLHLCQRRDGAETSERLAGFLQQWSPKVLNIAGPRASEEPEVGAFTRQVLDKVVAWLIVGPGS
jgi:hypothetical protein